MSNKQDRIDEIVDALRDRAIDRFLDKCDFDFTDYLDEESGRFVELYYKSEEEGLTVEEQTQYDVLYSNLEGMYLPRE